MAPSSLCNMVVNLREVDISYPAGHYVHIIIFTRAHLEKILGAPLVSVTQLGHVAFLEMCLDETNTSVKVSVPYLDYSGSYWQISVYVAVIGDIKMNRVVRNQ